MDKMSRLAAYRMDEEQTASVARSRREIERSGRPTLTTYRTRSDEELCDELQRLGLGVTRESFADLAAGHDSAEALARAHAESLGLELRGFEADCVWFCLWVLWERWLPERPSSEQVDDWVAEGCRQAYEDDHAAACAAWLRAWGFVRDLARARGLRSLDDVDAILQGSELFFNWVQDFEMALGNAGRDDDAWCREGLRFCREYLELFEPAEREITENMRRALAGFHFALGEADVCDRLYEEWLRADPQWGWGWIGWSDEYGMGRVPKDVARAEALLRRGLAVPGVQPVGDLRERLHSLHEPAEHREAEHDPEQATPIAPETYLRPAPKVGRNDPCPCGSGKKYKKCCLK